MLSNTKSKNFAVDGGKKNLSHSKYNEQFS